MMGQQNKQKALFYTICLDEFVPKNHLLRKIDAVLDLSFVRAKLEKFYSPIGRPSIDPELMIRILLIGYLMGIRSERRLVEEIALNLAYRWFCRLGLDDKVPHHSSFSKNRYERFRESGVYRDLFEQIVLQCMEQGLVEGEACSVDGCVISADANRMRRIPGTSSPEKLREQKRISQPVEDYLQSLDIENETAVKIKRVKKPSKPGPGKQIIKRRPPRFLSLTDPCAAWSAKHGPGEFAYETNYLIDNAKSIILDVEASPARLLDEVAAAKLMVERVDHCFGITPKRLAADKAYGTGAFLSWLLGRDIEPHIPVINHKHRAGNKYTQDRFEFLGDENCYICPAGQKLTFRGKSYTNRIDSYCAKPRICGPCPLKAECTSGVYRKTSRHWDEPARQRVEKIVQTEAFTQSSRERKMVEQRFAHLKRHLGFRRLKLRGLAGASEEFLLAALAQNLKILAEDTFALIFQLLFPCHSQQRAFGADVIGSVKR